MITPGQDHAWVARYDAAKLAYELVIAEFYTAHPPGRWLDYTDSADGEGTIVLAMHLADIGHDPWGMLSETDFDRSDEEAETWDEWNEWGDSHDQAFEREKQRAMAAPLRLVV